MQKILKNLENSLQMFCGVWEEEMLVLMLATNIFHVKIIRCTFYRNVISLAGQSRASLSWRSNRSTDTAFCSNVPAKYSSTKFILLGISLLYKNITYLRWRQKLCLPQNKIWSKEVAKLKATLVSSLLTPTICCPTCHLYQSIGKSFIFNQWMTWSFLSKYQIFIIF